MKKNDKIILAAVGIGALIVLAVLWPKPAAAAPTSTTPTPNGTKPAPLGCPF